MPAAEPEPGLAAALAGLAAGLESCRDPWWVVGSAAMALHGAPVAVADIDLLLSRRDASAQLARRGLPAAPGTADERFHSDLFGRWEMPPFAVELFAGFRVGGAAGWREIEPATREPISVAGGTLFVPAVSELIALGRLFGRAKDAEREPLLLKLLD